MQTEKQIHTNTLTHTHTHTSDFDIQELTITINFSIEMQVFFNTSTKVIDNEARQFLDELNSVTSS